ncbi:MAG: citrate synthase [Myxococcota bacterium]
MTDDWLTAEVASDLLGVKRATLYTYVSRGWIRSTGSGRTRRYDRADVEEVRRRSDAARGHAAAASGSMDWGAPVLESAVSSIDPDGPNYRGVPALTLGERDVSFERVAELLWTGELPAAAGWSAPDPGVDLPAYARLVPTDALVATALSIAAQALAAGDPMRGVLAERAEPERARVVIRRMVALSARVVGPEREWITRVATSLAAPTVADAVVAAMGAPPAAARWVNRALVLVADHELTASTFAARVAASTGADLYGCLGSALAAWSGPRHGRASEALEDALRRAARGESWSLGEVAPGFGHRLYPGGDPRCERLLSDAAALCPTDPRWAILVEITRVMQAAGHPPPTLDLGLVGLAIATGLPPRAPQLLFGVGRIAGWLAHAWEQRGSGRMLRPRARYVGP